jgi:hypothetical protein
MSEDHSADRTRLLALVPADGTAVGNTALIRQLGWAENRYWYARDSLLEAGVLVRARGRGMSVRRAHPYEGAAPEVNPDAELIGEAALAYVHENDLYPDIKGTLETFWAKERQIEPLGRGDHRSPGPQGHWWPVHPARPGQRRSPDLPVPARQVHGSRHLRGQARRCDHHDGRL